MHYGRPPLPVLTLTANQFLVFLAHGGAALILKFSEPWEQIFSHKLYPNIRGAVTCGACMEQTQFEFSTESMVWQHQMWCGSSSVSCSLCQRTFALNLTTHGSMLLLYICPNLKGEEVLTSVDSRSMRLSVLSTASKSKLSKGVVPKWRKPIKPRPRGLTFLQIVYSADC